MKRLLKLQVDKHISIEITQYKDNRKATTVYTNAVGWCDQYRNGETLFEVIINEIKTIKSKIKTNPQSKKDLKRLLKELQSERIKQSQLSLF